MYFNPFTRVQNESNCPYGEYKSNRHYNTQRHIHLTHGIGSWEPIDHMTGETRGEKKRAANESRNLPINVSDYPGPSPICSTLRCPEKHRDTELTGPGPYPVSSSSESLMSCS